MEEQVNVKPVYKQAWFILSSVFSIFFLIFGIQSNNVVGALVAIVFVYAIAWLISKLFSGIKKAAISAGEKIEERQDLLKKQYGEDGYARLKRKEIVIGDSAEFVRLSWGRPSDIDKKTTSSGIKEIWKYGQKHNISKTGKVSVARNQFKRYVEIMNGSVTSIEEK
jgi:molybdopterin-binding protein